MEFFKKQQLSIAYETTNNVAIINGITKIVFNRLNGSIIEIRNIKTGKVQCTVLECIRYARLFSIVLSTPQRFNKGHACYAHIRRNVIWAIDDNGVSIRYPDLICDDGQSSGCLA